jgi:choline dehydrogenase-like flavoprotein
VSYIPTALENGATLYTRFRVKKIDRSRRRWLVFGQMLDENSNPRGEFTAEGDVLVLAAGSLFTPIILKSSGFRHPVLGRELKVHPASRVIGMFEKSDEEGVIVELSDYLKGVPQACRIPLHDKNICIEGIKLPPSLFSVSVPGFAEEMSDYLKRYRTSVAVGFRIIDEARGNIIREVFGYPIIRYFFEGVDKFRFLSATKLAAQILFEAGAKEVLIPIYGMERIKNPDELKEISVETIDASKFEVSGYHSLGTCRMAFTSDLGVVDSVGRVYGESGLFITDASIFPDTPLVSPQLTTMAFSSICADYLLENMDRLFRFPPEEKKEEKKEKKEEIEEKKEVMEEKKEEIEEKEEKIMKPKEEEEDMMEMIEKME